MKKKISQEKMMIITEHLKNIEFNLTLCPTESIQLGGLIGLFKI